MNTINISSTIIEKEKVYKTFITMGKITCTLKYIGFGQMCYEIKNAR